MTTPTKRVPPKPTLFVAWFAPLTVGASLFLLPASWGLHDIYLVIGFLLYAVVELSIVLWKLTRWAWSVHTFLVSREFQTTPRA